jgi:hypothetical protein
MLLPVPLAAQDGEIAGRARKSQQEAAGRSLLVVPNAAPVSAASLRDRLMYPENRKMVGVIRNNIDFTRLLIGKLYYSPRNSSNICYDTVIFYND